MTQKASPEADARDAGAVSVVIPVWQESDAIFVLLRDIAAWPEAREVIVACAEETADFRVAAEAAGALCISAGRPNRGRQMNAGARHATGEWLLFHHADTGLTRAHVQALAALKSRAEIVGGAFHRRFDARHPHCRWIEPLERWRNQHFGALFGDQSLFVRREHFKELGGFAEIPLMEDIEFSKRLRRSGPLALLDPPIATSTRRHAKLGAWKTTLSNATLILLYHLGVPPERLHAWYYGIRKPVETPTPVITQPHEN
ncbi:MAG: TIGR04283 family arsenosugar biosynthesis glycosyltransferase [Chthoniobacteraceae bacterium]